ncbi:MAG TPA: alpha/beta family hydrolase [Granulicella sp.]|jgi:alpha/beta superfamily hydrolase|nr:alpha/beta family hydrolase [Granulicella sp.]
MSETTLSSSFRSHVRSIEDLHGPAGRLEAVLNAGLDDAPYAALVCHPHPPSGGTLHNKVVYHAMKAFSAFGLPVLRFNFRGVGLSEGVHDHGHGEQDDVRAALDWLELNLRKPILFAGFSFGSNVGMRACCGDTRVKGLIGLGLPVRAEGRDYTYGFLPRCFAPKLFVCGDHDQFAPRDVMQQVLTTAPEPKKMVWIEGADHFFQGIPTSPGPKLDRMQQAMRDWLAAEFTLSQPS